MHQFLTNKAQRSHLLDWPILVFSLIFGSAGISVTADYILKGRGNMIFIGVMLTTLMLLPAVLVLSRRVRASLAKRYARCFEHAGIRDFPISSMESQLPKRCSVNMLERLINTGYIQGVYVNRQTGMLVLGCYDAKAPEQHYSIQCPSCGAMNDAVSGQTCKCRFCACILPDVKGALS